MCHGYRYRHAGRCCFELKLEAHVHHTYEAMKLLQAHGSGSQHATKSRKFCHTAFSIAQQLG